MSLILPAYMGKEMPFCRKCGFEYNGGDEHCNKCGSEIGSTKAPPKEMPQGEVKKTDEGGALTGLFIGLFLLLIIGGVGYYGYSQYMQRQAFEKVQITPSGYKVSDIGLTSASIELDFTAYNPGDRTATLDRIEYQIYVNNQFLVDGAVPNRYDIYSHQTRTITTRASISYLNLGRGVWEALTSKKAQLRITGVAHIDTLIGTYDFPFEKVL